MTTDTTTLFLIKNLSHTKMIMETMKAMTTRNEIG
jgi:hypothetical protein